MYIYKCMYKFFVVGVKCDLFGIKQKIMNWWMRFREMNIYCMISERRILNVKAKWKKINWELNADRRCSAVYCYCSFFQFISYPILWLFPSLLLHTRFWHWHFTELKRAIIALKSSVVCSESPSPATLIIL